eukprot:TRINITY_DN8363_c0_g1_i1.p1 TRINITY_DN8363_c0_g1~~TRINITY_DN8363_c0_g1_i1.p1  ORF type:complete len:1020 (-),score=251.29 TRINITY_DN8363_c0_g1_i1:59-3118(-)
MQAPSLPASFDPTSGPTINNFLGLLQQTLSHHQQVRGPAEGTLLQWQAIPGYCSVLLEIISNQGTDQNLRLAAVLALKNAVSRCWKKHVVTNAEIGENEKQHIRVRLLQCLNEGVKGIALHLAIAISMIARIDFPRQWPAVLHQVSQVVQTSPSQLERERALLTLRHVVKALNSRRLVAGRKEFEEVAPQMFDFIKSLWQVSSDGLLAALSSFSKKEISEAQLMTNVSLAETCKRCLKIEQDLIVHGITAYHRLESVVHFINVIHDTLGVYIMCRDTVVPHNSPFFPFVNKLVLQKAQLIMKVQEAHPLSFTSLENSLKFFTNYIMQNAGRNDRADEQFIVICMMFLKNVLSCDQYREAGKESDKPITIKEISKGTPNENNSPSGSPYVSRRQQANSVVSSFFTQSLVAELCKILITRIFPMTPANLQEWEDNPEDFFNEEEADLYQEKKTVCAEKLFMTLLEKYRDWLGPIIVTMLRTILKDASASTLEGILMKDACYRAIGLGSFQLVDWIDFSSWFTGELVRELEVQDPRYKIIRRRVAWLIGCWVPQIPAGLRRGIYATVCVLLKEEDLVVGQTAANTLRFLIDDFKFHVEPFMEFLDTTITLLFQLLDRVQECDTKLRILTVIVVLIQQLEEKISPYTYRIVEYLKLLWKSSEPSEAYNLLKQAIVTAMVKLVQSGFEDPNSVVTEQFIVPIIRHSTDITQPDTIYLAEEGLLLWMNTVAQAKQMTSSLLALFPNLIGIMKNSYEHTKISMRIIEEYLLLGMADFLKTYMQDLVVVWHDCIVNTIDEGIVCALKPIEIFVQLFPQEAPKFLDGILQKLLAMTLEGADSASWVAVHYLSIFARILLVNPEAFFAFFQKIGIQNLLPFLECWFERFDTMSQYRMKVLTALSLCNLLPTKIPEILQYTGQIINVCLSVLNMQSLRNEDSTEHEDFELFVDDDEIATKGASAAKLVLFNKDPVNSASLFQTFLGKLQEMRNLLGEESFNRLMQTVDPSILSQLQALPGRVNEFRRTNA